MKRILISMVLVLPVLLAQSQDAVDVLTQETCDCISKKNLDNLSQDQINLELGVCIMESLSKHSGEYEELNVDLNDQASFQKLGEQIGFRMASVCPQILMKVATVQNAGDSEVTKPVSELTGILKRIEGDDFQYVIVAEDGGREHKFLWLRYFKGSEKLIEEKKQVIGKRVKITYLPIETFSAKLNDYTNRKEIKGLQVLN